jgi:hypothetical protein
MYSILYNEPVPRLSRAEITSSNSFIPYHVPVTVAKKIHLKVVEKKYYSISKLMSPLNFLFIFNYSFY